MWRKQGVVQGTIFALGFLIMVFTLLIILGGKLQALSALFLSAMMMGALVMLGWFIVDKAC